MAAMPDDDRVHTSIGLIYAGLGRKDEALHHGERGRQLMPYSLNTVQGPFRVWEQAMIQAQVGEHEAALESLEWLLTVPSAYSVHWVEVEGAFDTLRDLPKYHELIERFSTDILRPAS